MYHTYVITLSTPQRIMCGHACANVRIQCTTCCNRAYISILPYMPNVLVYAYGGVIICGLDDFPWACVYVDRPKKRNALERRIRQTDNPSDERQISIPCAKAYMYRVARPSSKQLCPDLSVMRWYEMYAQRTKGVDSATPSSVYQLVHSWIDIVEPSSKSRIILQHNIGNIYI